VGLSFLFFRTHFSDEVLSFVLTSSRLSAMIWALFSLVFSPFHQARLSPKYRRVPLVQNVRSPSFFPARFQEGATAHSFPILPGAIGPPWAESTGSPSFLLAVFFLLRSNFFSRLPFILLFWLGLGCAPLSSPFCFFFFFVFFSPHWAQSRYFPLPFFFSPKIPPASSFFSLLFFG